MKTKKTITMGVRIALVFIFIAAVFSPAGASYSPVTAPAEPAAAPDQQEPDNPYFSIQTATMADGTELEGYIINGPPTPPVGYEQERKAVEASKLNSMASLTLTVPVFNWFYGCSATSGAMIAGYYDRNGYPNMYTGPTNGGVMPLNNTSWGNWTDGAGDSYGQCPLTASRNGLDGRTTRGSIDDYWVAYNSSTQDPFITGGWLEHTYGAAIGDYMRTSQSNYGNSDGGTQFWNYNNTNPGPLTCDVMVDGGITNDGSVGRRAFYQAKGYTVTDCYNQKTDNNSGGFTFAMYQAEINAGRPVMINLAGHTIVGVGYDDVGNTVYIHDTWDHLVHSFTWGGSYGGMTLLSVSIVNLAAAACNTPTTPSLTSPSNGGTVATNTPTFDWSDSTYANVYDFVLDNNSDFSSPIVNNTAVSTSAYTVASTLANGTYYWKVRGHNTSGGCDVYGSWSTTWSFTVNAGTPPGAFNKSAPSNGATYVSTSPTLSWGTSTGAEGYEYCYYPAGGGSCTSWMSNGTATSKTLSGLLHTTTYYWHVRAYNSAGYVYSNSNSEWSFTTEPGEDIFYSHLPVINYTKAYTGKVTYNSAAIAGVRLNMAYSSNYGSSWVDQYATTTTDSKGNFIFSTPPPLGDGHQFAVYYDNPTDDTKYLWYFECNLVDSMSDSHVCNFDIRDVTLSSPANGATKSSPVTFSWQRRPFTTDHYYWRLYNTNFDDDVSIDVGYVGSVKIYFCGSAWAYTNYWWIDVSTPYGYGFGTDENSIKINAPACPAGDSQQELGSQAMFEAGQASNEVETPPFLAWLLANGKKIRPTGE